MWLGLAPLLFAVVFLLVVGRLHRGLGQQWRVALAKTPDSLPTAIARAGGAPSVRAGLWLDGIFIVTFGLSAILLLRGTGAWWTVPLAGAAVDVLENVLIAVVISRPSAPGTGTLFAVAVLKFLLYALTLGALVCCAIR
jgi:hypothetical protein